MALTTTEHLRFAPEILRRLGEELGANLDQGILELVRNAYDADARNCTVALTATDEPGGTLCIEDDGNGMDLDTLRSGWLLLGRSLKVTQPALTRLGRQPIGEKGLGRLAALRLGTNVHLMSRPCTQRGTEYCLAIDWRQFDVADAVEDIPIRIMRHETTKPPGTSIEIRNLSWRIRQREIKRLARSLLLLADPFGFSPTGFRPILVAPEFKELEHLVKDNYFDEADFHLVATLKEGSVTRQVFNKQRRILSEKSDIQNSDARNCVDINAEFRFWTFLLGQGQHVNRSVSTGELRTWLNIVGGVHLYHKGLRVFPYGEQGHDWLEMNLARARSPEERPSTNNSIGFVRIEDPQYRLTPKTDRTGFIENEDFLSIRSFAVEALNWMAQERLRVSEKRRSAKRTVAPGQSEQARIDLDKATARIAMPQKTEVEKAIQQWGQAIEEEKQTTREELQLYRTLATVGTTMAVFAHEAARPISLILQMARSIAARAQVIGNAQYKAKLEKPVSIVMRSAQNLQNYSSLVLNLIRRNKRRVRPVALHQVLLESMQPFQPILEKAGIEWKFDLDPIDPVIWGSAAAMEAIVSNLLINAVSAMHEHVHARTFCIQTEMGTDSVRLSFLDSGPGIKNIALDDIWLPGKSTLPEGTGLGLTIVKDTVADLGGTILAIPQGRLGGAEFIIELPVWQGK